jgi:hypothetical protein
VQAVTLPQIMVLVVAEVDLLLQQLVLVVQVLQELFQYNIRNINYANSITI